MEQVPISLISIGNSHLDFQRTKAKHDVKRRDRFAVVKMKSRSLQFLGPWQVFLGRYCKERGKFFLCAWKMWKETRNDLRVSIRIPWNSAVCFWQKVCLEGLFAWICSRLGKISRVDPQGFLFFVCPKKTLINHLEIFKI